MSSHVPVPVKQTHSVRSLCDHPPPSQARTSGTKLLKSGFPEISITRFFRLLYHLQYPSVLSAWALTVFKFVHLVAILVFEDKILMYIVLNTAKFQNVH